MKRFTKILLSAFLVVGTLMFSHLAKAQTGDFAGLIPGSTVTHTNAQVDTVAVDIQAGRSSITFKYDISKTSGTVAGTIVLKGRITTSSGEQWATINTYTLTDATATNYINFTNNQFTRYLIITTTTGTSVTVHNKYLLYRR